MTLAVLGPDDFTNFAFLAATLDSLYQAGLLPRVGALLTGEPRGTGALVARYARQRGLPVRELVPDTISFGAQAAPMRDSLLVQASDAVVAFQGEVICPATEHALQLARARGLRPVLVVHLPA